MHPCAGEELEIDSVNNIDDDVEIDKCIKNSDFGILLIDPATGEIQFSNQGACELLDSQPNFLVDKDISNLIKTTDNSKDLSHLIGSKEIEKKSEFTALPDNEELGTEPFKLLVDWPDQGEASEALVILQALNDTSSESSSNNKTSSSAISNLTFDEDTSTISDDNLLQLNLNEFWFNHMRDEIYIFDVETAEIIEFNERVPDKLGYSADELEELTIFDFVREYKDHEFWQERMKQYRNNPPVSMEGHHVKKNGRSYPVEAKSTLVKDDDQEFLITVARDISERKAREEESESLFHSVNDAISVHDLDNYEMIDVNETAVDMLGYDRETILEIGIDGISLSKQGYNDEFAEEIMKETYRDEESVEPFEWPVETKDGEVIWLEVNPTIIQIDGEERFFAISRDVTRRKRAREELDYQKSILEALQDAAEEGILAVGNDQEILFYNDRFQELWEFPDEALADRDDAKALDYALDKLENPEEFLETVEELYEDPHREQKDVIHLKDERIFERFSGPIELDDDVIGRVWFFRDITDKRRVKNQLEQSLEEKETLLEEVHHRVKNNMQIVVSMLKLQMNELDSDKLRETFQDSINRLKTMALIHEKLYRSEHLSEISLPHYIYELSENIRKTYKIDEEIDLQYDIEELKLEIEDAISCGLLINELISNAFEHGNFDNCKGEISIEMHRSDQEVTIRVSDNGGGTRTDINLSNPENTGLRIVQSIVDLDLDGEINFFENAGLTVEITFKLE